ncbi:MAG: HD-GYP domain-containing protein [Planctomycetota bacterium]|jgi:HD-GYP domain-containing protein (c-di-GMP phosphodiesterase class II)
MTAVADQAEQAPEAGDKVAVGLDELILGRPIEFPIYDDRGVLLLAEGSVITSEFKRLLRQRDVGGVQVDARDVSRVTLSSDIHADSTFSFDNDLTKHLDHIIDGGMAPVQNDGPAVKDGLISRGTEAYNADQRNRLTNQNNESHAALAGAMKAALHGGAANGASMSKMAGSYLKEMQSDVDSVLTSTLGMFDNSSLSAQALQTSLLAMAIGVEMDLDADNVRMLGLVGMVHDWGMMRVPEHIRDSGGRLSSADFYEIKKHPIYSLEMLQKATSMPGLVSLVSYQIHECPNGSGYPRGRAGNAIHQFARIVAVADAYTALTTPRAWRAPYMAYAAVECLLRDAQQRKVDSAVVRALLHVLSLFPVGSLVTLSDGSVARVMRRNGDAYTSPIVQRLQDASGERVDPISFGNIIDLQQSELNVEQALPTPGRNELTLSAALADREEHGAICG